MLRCCCAIPLPQCRSSKAIRALRGTLADSDRFDASDLGSLGSEEEGSGDEDEEGSEVEEEEEKADGQYLRSSFNANFCAM